MENNIETTKLIKLVRLAFVVIAIGFITCFGMGALLYAGASKTASTFGNVMQQTNKTVEQSIEKFAEVVQDIANKKDITFMQPSHPYNECIKIFFAEQKTKGIKPDFREGKIMCSELLKS
ncbi:MAG: hypothetical protein ACI9CD_000721 [Candidatus Deianiraeaceae bacterium]|jgi:hypothetical protein